MPRRRKRSERNDEEEELDEKKRRGSVYFELSASEDENGDDEEDFDDADDGFFVDTVEDIPDEDAIENRVRKSPLVCRGVDDELDVDAMEKMVNERYGSKFSHSYDYYDDDIEQEFEVSSQEPVFPSARDPKLWLVKCLPGHERKVVASLMQKSLDKGYNSHILSAIALDHLTNYIYVEAHSEASVIQGCKGMRNVFARNITMVPMNEMSSVLSVEPKEAHMFRGDWVRLKRSSCKGELAKVVDVDDVNQKVTVKVIPKLGAQSLSDQMIGTDYMYKTVALSSVCTRNINPSIQEVENLRQIGEDDVDIANLFKGKDKGCWLRGDAVVVVKGELKNLKGSIDYVDGDIIHIKPKEKMTLTKVAVHKRDLFKYFEQGSHVKVVRGRHEGATGMVVKVDQNKLVILSNTLKDHITVFAEQVIESKETSETSSKEGISSIGSRRMPQSVSSSNLLRRSHKFSPPLGQKTGQCGKRHDDSFIGCKVKILNGPYRGYRGCVKGVNGQNVRVELEAQMKVITVNRNHISDKLASCFKHQLNATRQCKPTGGETPLHPCTPLHPMEGKNTQ